MVVAMIAIVAYRGVELSSGSTVMVCSLDQD